MSGDSESSTAEGGGVSRDSGERARSATEGAALSEAERGMAEMSQKFAEVGKELYVSASGEKCEAIG